MNLQRLRIQNFKSLVDLEIINPNPFTVFVGPNAAGKSNIFEALEFLNFCFQDFPNRDQLFGGKNLININSSNNRISLNGKINDKAFYFAEYPGEWLHNLPKDRSDDPMSTLYIQSKDDLNLKQLIHRFSRIFVKNEKLEKFNFEDLSKLTISARNLEVILKKILHNSNIAEEFIEWLQLFIPEFENIEIHTDIIREEDTLFIYEKHSKKPFNKALISDGTYNILALLTAVFQSDEPQFLCIEEPENGLHPKVVKELVDFFRSQCEEKGHYIWLNTHSQTLVRELKPEELILVDKTKGATQIKQLRNKTFENLKMDDAWLTNTLGGGLPW